MDDRLNRSSHSNNITYKDEYFEYEFTTSYDEIGAELVHCNQNHFDFLELPTKIAREQIKNINELVEYEKEHNLTPIPYLDLIAIRDSAFLKCTITSIIIPNTVLEAGDLSSSSIEYATIPAHAITAIIPFINNCGCGDYQKNESLKELVITSGKSIRHIHAINYCTALKRLYLPDSLSVIDSYSLTSLKKDFFNVKYNVKYVGSKNNPYLVAISMVDSSADQLYINDGCKILCDRAFEECKMSFVKLPGSLINMGEATFWNCRHLSKINVPKRITSIDKDTFIGCVKLVEINNQSSLNIEIGSTDHGFIACNALNVYPTKNYTYCENNKVHYSKTGESKLSFGGNGCIYYEDNNEKLLVNYTGDKSKIIIPEGVTGIHQYAFSFIDSNSITLPNTVKYIDSYAFFYSKIDSITLPSSLKKTGDAIFSTYYGFHPGRINYLGTIENWCDIDFGIDTDQEFFSNDTYAQYHCFTDLYINGELITNLTIPGTIKKIKSYTFPNIKSITTLNIENGVERLERYAFRACNNLTTVTLPKSLKFIADSAFHYCENIKTIINHSNLEIKKSSSGIPEDAIIINVRD